MNTPARFFVSLLLLFSIATPLTAGENWPAWRGPSDDGTLMPGDGENYATQWAVNRDARNLNVIWTADLEAPGNSSPIVWGERLFLTQGENDNRQRSLICFDTKTGKQVWKKIVERSSDDPTHKTNPGVSASPLTDGKLVIAWHGNAGLHAYDFDGKEVWSADLGDDYAHIWGANAGSPVFFENLVIIHAGPGIAARLIAVDRSDGTIVWKKELPEAKSDKVGEFKGSWTTPRIVDNGGRAEIIVPLPGRLASFDLASGDELWSCAGLGNLYYTNALISDDIIVAMGGYGGPAIGMRRPGSTDTGDLTDSHRLWHITKPKPPQRIGSGQIIGDHIYMVNAPGLAQCLELKTGKTVWKERLGRETWSSLNLVGGLLYSTDKSSTTFVIDPSPDGLKVVATNKVTPPEDNANSTPAFSGGVIYLRTPTALYGITGGGH